MSLYNFLCFVFKWLICRLLCYWHQVIALCRRKRDGLADMLITFGHDVETTMSTRFARKVLAGWIKCATHYGTAMTHYCLCHFTCTSHWFKLYYRSRNVAQFAIYWLAHLLPAVHLHVPPPIIFLQSKVPIKFRLSFLGNWILKLEHWKTIDDWCVWNFEFRELTSFCVRSLREKETNELTRNERIWYYFQFRRIQTFEQIHKIAMERCLISHWPTDQALLSSEIKSPKFNPINDAIYCFFRKFRLC